MRCIHCIYDCTLKGEDISWETFKLAADLARKADDDICIGGGEPTLHPEFLRMVRYAVKIWGPSYKGFDHVMVITNGTCSKSVWSRLIRIPDLEIKVSNDIFHNPRRIQPWVRSWAERTNNWWNPGDYYDIDLQGRAPRNRKAIQALCRKHKVEVTFDGFSCPEVVVEPSGKVIADHYALYDCGPLSLEALKVGYLEIGRKDCAQELEEAA
jgi:hypothetical protein